MVCLPSPSLLQLSPAQQAARKLSPPRPPRPQTVSPQQTQVLPMTTPLHHFPHLQGRPQLHSSGSPTSPSRSMSPQPPSSFFRVTSAYTAQTSIELSLHPGDILVEIDRPTPSMWYGMLDDGTTGLFPASAVEPLLTPRDIASTLPSVRVVCASRVFL